MIQGSNFDYKCIINKSKRIDKKNDLKTNNIKYLKIVDLIMSIIFVIFFFYKYQITESYEYGFGQLIELFIQLPVIILLLISLVMSIIAIFDKKEIYLFSIISQILKIVSFLLNFIVIKFLLRIVYKIDYMILIPIYAILMLTILIIYKRINTSKKVKKVLWRKK